MKHPRSITRSTTITVAAAAAAAVLAPGIADAEPVDDTPIDRTRTPIEIDTRLPTTPLEPAACEAEATDWPVVGRSQRVGMGGTGARPDELSIRGKRGTYMLHLERFGGQDSSLPLTTPVGHVPAIVGLVDLDVAQPFGASSQPPHPSPADDEAFVDLGARGFVGSVGMFGTDANGCLAAYTFETESGSEPFEVPYRDQSWFRSGWSCPYGMVQTFDAARQTGGNWHLSRRRLHRTHPTGVGSDGGGWWNVPSTAEMPEIGEGC